MNRLVSLSFCVHTLCSGHQSNWCEVIPVFSLFGLWERKESLIQGFVFIHCHHVLTYILLWKFLICPRSSNETKKRGREKSVSEKSQVRQNSIVLCMCELYPNQSDAMCCSQAHMSQPIKCLSCQTTDLFIECSE